MNTTFALLFALIYGSAIGLTLGVGALLFV
jgi:hypothetical protein